MKTSEINNIEDFDSEIHTFLFNAHTHAELCTPEEIVYRERDVIALIKKTIELYEPAAAVNKL